MNYLTEKRKELIKDHSFSLSEKDILSVMPKKDSSDALLVDSDFTEGKSNNKQSARNLVEKYITDEFIDKAYKKYSDKNIIFLTVPSSSKKNCVPIELAEYLSEELNKKGCATNTLVSDTFIDSYHSLEMKRIRKSLHRVYATRLYEIEDKQYFDELRDMTKDFEVVLVEDILTTGASLNAFKNFLGANGVKTSSVIALKGSDKLYPNEKEIAKAVDLFTQFGINEEKACILTSSLTTGELGGLYTHYSVERKNLQKNPSEEKKEDLVTIWNTLYEARINSDEDAVDFLQRIVVSEIENVEKKKAKRIENRTPQNSLNISNLPEKNNSALMSAALMHKKGAGHV